MVRHEAAMSLGDIVGAAEAASGDYGKLAALKVPLEFIAAAKKALMDGLKDKEPLVSDSCALALDIADYIVADGRFQYAEVPTPCN